MRQGEFLINRLAAYARSNMYPFHIPGRKRKTEPEDFFMNSCVDSFINPFAVGIVEIKGFDNPYHPEDILRGSMKWAAGVYEAGQTYYMINGSTGGIPVAICGSVPRGGRILVSRNCHKSVYHGICLNQLKASYVYPQEIEGLEIQEGITAEDMDGMFDRYIDTQTVLIVCPTHDGIVPDIETITRIVHRAGLPLVIGEAHGARFCYDTVFPVPALDLGVDAVIQSIHKTLSSLTQTALLHIKCSRPDGGCYADRERTDRYTHMVQSNNPSYVLMVSIENSIYQMEQTDVAPYRKQLHRLRRGLGQIRHLRLTGTGLIEQAGIRDPDISKVVVSTRGACLYPAEDGLTGFTGAQLDGILRRKYHPEMEMCGIDYVAAIAMVMDSGEGLKRLGDTLARIDSQLTGAGYKPDGHSRNQKSTYSMRCDTAMSMGEAVGENIASVGLEDSAGCISGEFVYIYPPGIPVVTPGEWINRPTLEVVLGYGGKGLSVQGSTGQSLRTVRVVQEG